MNPARYSFTVKSSTTRNRLVSPCAAYKAWAPDRGAAQPPRRQFNALWDTGATNSMITSRAVADLGLEAGGYPHVHHVQGTTNEVPFYFVNLVLFSNFHFPDVAVILGELTDTDLLIGMDIINRGDFAVSNRNGATSFSFRIPSIADFDFAAEDNISGSSGSAINGDHEPL